MAAIRPDSRHYLWPSRVAISLRQGRGHLISSRRSKAIGENVQSKVLSRLHAVCNGTTVNPALKRGALLGVGFWKARSVELASSTLRHY